MRQKKNLNNIKLFIHGDVFILKKMVPGKNNMYVESSTKMSKRMSKKAIKLWFLIHDEKFDQELWDDLTLDEKKYIYILVEELSLPKPIEYKLASLDLTKDLFDRLELLEGNIRAGNINPELIKEAEEILLGIVELGEMSAQKKTRYLKKLRNTYEYILSSQEL